jgi:hypothetical protein
MAVHQGSGVRPAKKKLKLNFLMPYLDDLADVAFKLSGYLDCADEWANIRIMEGSPSDHLQELFRVWLQNGSEDSPCTWEFLIQTIRNVNKGDVADRMEMDVFGMALNLPQSPVQETGIGQPASLQLPQSTVPHHCLHHHGSPGTSGIQTSSQGHLPPHSPPTEKEVLQQTPIVQDVCRLIGKHISADWRQFGTYLGVKNSQMMKLRKDNPHSLDDCFLQLVENWLQRDESYGDSPRTWETVLWATKEAAHTSLSLEVKDELLKRPRR